MRNVLWLYARGPQEQTLRWPLGPGRWLVGRIQTQPHQLVVPWDSNLSRQHFLVACDGESVDIRRCETASNPVFWKGEPCQAFRIHPGEHFVAGQTRFQCVLKSMQESPESALEFTLAHGARQRLQEKRANECLEALTRLLPSLRAARELDELWRAAVDILADLLPQAIKIFPLRVTSDGTYSYELPGVEGHYAPSKRLLNLAFDSGQTAIHQWSLDNDTDMTIVNGFEWALATPIQISETERYALYALGSGDHQSSEQERALVDLVGEALGHYLSARRADRLRAQVGQFFSPTLRSLIDERGLTDLMQPARATVTVLFFDLRGFSKATEQAEGEALEAVLKYHAFLTEIMSKATKHIFNRDGIVLDFAGDAIMAGWGAPQVQDDHAERAVSAAVEIVTSIQSMKLPFWQGSTLRCGLGLDCGEVVAGQVGGREQVKYGWMGKVVNQAARLEGLTKPLGLPILISGAVRERLGPRTDLRRIGRARPAGMNEILELHEVVLDREHGGSGLTGEEILAYERAQRHFEEGQMLEAIKGLRRVPVEDPVTRFLTRLAYRYEESGVPQPWSGVIEFLKK